MDKENEVSIHNGLSFSFKKREIVSFVTTRMRLEDMRLRELFRTAPDL